MGAPRSFSLASAILLRGLGLVLAIAFVSLSLQIDSLISTEGILPLEDYLSSYQEFAWSKYWAIPSLFWISCSDFSLYAVLCIGTLSSVAILLGYYARTSLILACACWLSLLAVGQGFLSYQWDVLLLECCFLAILSYPNTRKLALRETPSLNPFALLLFRLLLFRLMFSSGFVKLASGDLSWSSLEALKYHFLTQPLPTAFAPLFHQAPESLLIASCFAMFVIELLLPFCVFGPRLLQMISGICFLVFQLLIALTGNYTYFNFLSILLLLPLFDDALLSRLLRFSPSAQVSQAPSRFRDIAYQPLKLFVLVLGIGSLFVLVAGYQHSPTALKSLMNTVRPLRIVNQYGLFAVMTTKRFELQFEGSNDGEEWKEYQLRWKPGDINVAPRFLAPHQARIDWQLWFASLGPLARHQWVLPFSIGVLEGRPSITKAFRYNPFEEQAPKYLRILRYEYKFATRFERSSENRWWERKLLGIYLPPISLKIKGTEDATSSPSDS